MSDNLREDARTGDRAVEQEWSMSWLGGLALIIIGAVFLLQNLTGLWFHNWWALFIALPGALALATAWKLYRQNGKRLDNRVVGAAMGGVFPLLVAAIFVLDLNWGMVWPLFLIVGGLGALLSRTAPGR